eukprot:6477112-Amphidinium_carterae.2
MGTLFEHATCVQKYWASICCLAFKYNHVSQTTRDKRSEHKKERSTERENKYNNKLGGSNAALRQPSGWHVECGDITLERRQPSIVLKVSKPGS